MSNRTASPAPLTSWSAFLAEVDAQDEATRAHLEATRVAPTTRVSPLAHRPTYYWGKGQRPAAGI